MSETTNSTKQALKDLWDLIIDYDLELEIEESAQELDDRTPTDKFGFRNQAWARLLGIMEAVKVELGISPIQAAFDRAVEEQGLEDALK